MRVRIELGKRGLEVVVGALGRPHLRGGRICAPPKTEPLGLGF